VCAEASRAVALTAISEYYRRAVHEQAVAANPCAFVRRPAPAAEKQNQARSISRPQATRLLAAARERSPLHELLVGLLFFNGRRASEAAAAGLEDLGEHDGHRILRVRGKGETETNQRVPLNAPTVTALEAWLTERVRIAGTTAGTGPLLISPAHRPPADALGDPRPRRAPRPQRRRRPPQPARAARHDGHARTRRRHAAARRPGLRSPRRPAHHPPLRPRPHIAQRHTALRLAELGDH